MRFKDLKKECSCLVEGSSCKAYGQRSGSEAIGSSEKGRRVDLNEYNL